jgi:hypothetical protein
MSEQGTGCIESRRSPNVVFGLQKTTVAQWIPDERKQQDFNNLLNAEKRKAAGAVVTIPVRYELETQYPSSPLALSDPPLTVCHCPLTTSVLAQRGAGSAARAVAKAAVT